MQYDDLKFTIPDMTGRKIDCEILSLIPKSKDEAYVVYTNREIDENANIILLYGRLLKAGNDYVLKGDITPEEIQLIKDGFHEDLVDYSRMIMEDK